MNNILIEQLLEIFYIDYIINLFCNLIDHIVNLWIIHIIFIGFLILLVSNPIHAVLLLIYIFINISCIFLLLNVDFIFILILIIYVGAISILFLFIIMMFNIQIHQSKNNIIKVIPLITLILLSLIYFIKFEFNLNLLNSKINVEHYNYKFWINILNSHSNIEGISIIYSEFIILFLLASIILLVAMIGSIILTLKIESQLTIKHQNYYSQNRKDLYNSLVLLNVNKTNLFRGNNLLKIYFYEGITILDKYK